MSYFAVIDNNIVINTIIADSKEIAETVTNSTCVEYTEKNPAGIGWTYDEVNDVFVAPSTPEIIDVEEVTPTPALEG